LRKSDFKTMWRCQNPKKKLGEKEQRRERRGTKPQTGPQPSDDVEKEQEKNEWKKSGERRKISGYGAKRNSWGRNPGGRK